MIIPYNVFDLFEVCDSAVDVNLIGGGHDCAFDVRSLGEAPVQKRTDDRDEEFIRAYNKQPRPEDWSIRRERPFAAATRSRALVLGLVCSAGFESRILGSSDLASEKVRLLARQLGP